MSPETIPAKTMDTFLFSYVTGIALVAEKIKWRFWAIGTLEELCGRVPKEFEGLRDRVFKDYEGLEVTKDADGLGASVQHFGRRFGSDALFH